MRTTTSFTCGWAALIVLTCELVGIVPSARADSEQVVTCQATTDGQAALSAPDDGQEKSERGDGTALRAEDELWLINTRQLGCPQWKGGAHFDLEVSRLAGDDTWVESDVHELFNSQPRQTIIYVHGNRVNFAESIHRGREAFATVQSDPAAPPLRLIIWSWPSDQIHGQVRDVRTKASRTNTEGQYLGWFLSQMNTDTDLSLIGYSFGARVITGALHVLGGGTLCGQSTPISDGVGERRAVKVVLLAAALHNYWLAPGGYHEQFWSFADGLMVLYNSCDPVLRRYRLIEKRARPVALGFTGASGLEADLAARTEQRDVCGSVGKTHSEAAFFSSAEVIENVQRHVLLPAAYQVD